MTLPQREAGLFGDRAAELAGHSATLLGWRPGEFWESTPSELEAALGIASEAEAAMDRNEMERLAKLFPDNRDR